MTNQRVHNGDNGRGADSPMRTMTRWSTDGWVPSCSTRAGERDGCGEEGQVGLAKSVGSFTVCVILFPSPPPNWPAPSLSGEDIARSLGRHIPQSAFGALRSLRYREEGGGGTDAAHLEVGRLQPHHPDHLAQRKALRQHLPSRQRRRRPCAHREEGGSCDQESSCYLALTRPTSQRWWMSLNPWPSP